MPKKGDREALVVRDNRLVRASYFLTPPEKRFVYWLIWSYQQTKSRELTVSICELAKYCEIEGGSIYKTMYEVAHRLQGRVVVVWDAKEEAPAFVNFTEKIVPDLGNGTIKAVVHSAIEPLLNNLQANFTITALETAVRLSSFYSMRLYDLAVCHKHRTGGVLYTVNEIKAELGVLALARKNKTEVEIREDRWPVWKQFKQKVLDRACEEVNEKTDVEVVLEPIRTGKQITHVRLTSRSNKKGLALAGLTDKEAGLAARLTGAGLSATEARKVVEQYAASDPERITWHVEHCKSAKQPVAWLRAGLKQDYRPQATLDFAQRKLEHGERAREARLRERPHSGEGAQPIGELLQKIEDPRLAAALQRMGKSVKKDDVKEP